MSKQIVIENPIINMPESWEQKMAQVLEEMDEVVSYVKNHTLGFTIKGEEHACITDYIVRLKVRKTFDIAITSALTQPLPLGEEEDYHSVLSLRHAPRLLREREEERDDSLDSLAFAPEQWPRQVDRIDSSFKPSANERRPGDGASLEPSPLGRGQGEGLSSHTISEPTPIYKSALPPEFLARIRELRRNETDAEHIMWSTLRDRQFLGYKFRRQHPINGYILDFYCHQAKLAIELDGGQHNEPQQAKYDRQRTKNLEELGIRVIRFWNNDVLRDTQAVMVAIERELVGDTMREADQQYASGVVDQNGTLTPTLSPWEREEERGDSLKPSPSPIRNGPPCTALDFSPVGIGQSGSPLEPSPFGRGQGEGLSSQDENDISQNEDPYQILNLIIEVSSAARKDKAAKVATACNLWVPAININGEFGTWAFLEISDSWDAKNAIRDFIIEYIRSLME